jgi:shikimate kinase
MKLILTGFMGSGKTTISQSLAKKLNFNQCEMDQLILKKNNCHDMNELFAKGGEILLREWEIKLAKEMRNTKDIVISTGGGVVMNKIILDYLKENEGIVIFLKATFVEIEHRLKNDTTRPLFKDKQLAQDLFNFRLPLYQKYADYTITTTQKSVEAITNEIISFIKL